MNDKIKSIRRHFDHDAAKQILKEKYEAKMLFVAFDGMWKAGPDLITILNLYHGILTEVVLLDEYGNPCEVNAVSLLAQSKERWQEQMNAWHLEFTELQKQR